MQITLFETAPPDLFHFERQAATHGYRLIAGIDEAGRGPLAGPVIAAAVILDPEQPIAGVNDSKQLSERQREHLFEEIMAKALAIGTGTASPERIDMINILQATRHAMREAVSSLPQRPDLLLIDGITTIDSPICQQTIKKGDSRSASIAAASIIAKVTRDRLMIEYDKQYPQYGFARHKGYGSPQHLQALRSFGPCPIHRVSFRGVKELVPQQ